MNGLIKQLFTPNCPGAQLAEHTIEDLRRICQPAWVQIQGVLKKFCLNFHKMKT